MDDTGLSVIFSASRLAIRAMASKPLKVSPPISSDTRLTSADSAEISPTSVSDRSSCVSQGISPSGLTSLISILLKVSAPRFGTPYLSARPYGIRGTCEWIERVSQITGISSDNGFVKGHREEALRLISPALPVFRHAIREHPVNARMAAGGHADVVKGILSFACGELSLSKGACWCDCPDMADGDLPYYTEEQWTEAIQSQEKALLMASGEALSWAGCNTELQLSNPDVRWRLYPYEPPFVGFCGAVHLANLWVNAIMEKE